jgi:hypothetical protein
MMGGGINGEWHRKHPMPERPTIEQRALWHMEHEEKCGCRPVPENPRAKVSTLRLERKGRRAD